MICRLVFGGGALLGGREGTRVLRTQLSFPAQASEAAQGFLGAHAPADVDPSLLERAFSGEAGQKLQLFSGGQEVRLLLGVGKPEGQDGHGVASYPAVYAALRNAAGLATQSAAQLQCAQLVLELPLLPAGTRGEEALQALVQGAVLSNWAFDGYLTDPKRKFHRIQEVVLVPHPQDQQLGDPAMQPALQRAIQVAEAAALGTLLARNLVNERGDVAHPQYFQEQAEKLVQEFPNALQVSTIQADELREMGAGLITAVGQAAAVPPRVVFVEYRGNPEDSSFHGLLGKGVTYDTGGLNLKPTGFMEKMYMDCGGASTVLGTLQAVASLGLKLNIVGVLALAENSIDAKAYKPGAVLKSLNGKTVEVGNTDAEGRLCLADAMTLMQKKYDLKQLIEFSTLTGACAVALGEHAAGLFSDNADLVAALEQSGLRTGDRVWRMPLLAEYLGEIKGAESDLSNTGESRYGGACTAAAFLHQFVDLPEGRGWAHLDIAGVAMASKSHKSWSPKNGTGFGVRLMLDYYLQTEGMGQQQAQKI